MAYEDLLTHTCDIYKQEKVTKEGTYGAPTQEIVSYPNLPTYNDVKCFVALKNNVLEVNEPGVNKVQRFTIHFLPDTDVSLGDLIEFQGAKYKLEVPIPIRNHHIEVEAVREKDG